MKAIIKLKDGSQMTAELYEDVAPISVRNFVKLAKSGFYDGLIFQIYDPGRRHVRGSAPQKGGLHQGRVRRQRREQSRQAHLGRAVDGARGGPRQREFAIFCMRRGLPAFGRRLCGVRYAAFGKLCDKASEDVAVAISKVRTTRRGWFDDVPASPIVIDTIEIED